MIEKDLMLHRTLDELNVMMHERQLPNDLRRSLRTYFRHVRLTDTMKYFAFLREMSPDMRKQVCKHVNAAWTEQVWFLRDMGDDFLADIGMHFEPQILAQKEMFGDPQVLYILNMGLVARKGRVLRKGAVWGEDVILSCVDLCEDPKVIALTYAEVLSLRREQLDDVARKLQYDSERKKLRRSVVRLATFRGILQEAERRKRFSVEESVELAKHDGVVVDRDRARMRTFVPVGPNEVSASSDSPLPPTSYPALSQDDPGTMDLARDLLALRDALDHTLSRFDVATRDAAHRRPRQSTLTEILRPERHMNSWNNPIGFAHSREQRLPSLHSPLGPLGIGAEMGGFSRTNTQISHSSRDSNHHSGPSREISNMSMGLSLPGEVRK
jgi:hypothetical protein